MNFKKTVAFLLAAQMLLVSAASCGNASGGNASGGKSETDADETKSETGATDAETEPVETKFDRLSVSDELPAESFGGRDFRFIANEWAMFQLVSDDTTGVGLDAEIYERNQRVEDRFDVKITATYTLGMESQDIINTYVNVGEHIGEVCDQGHRMGLTPPCYGEYLNWLEFNYINWDQPWWNQGSNYNSTINGKLFTVTGDLSVRAMLDTWIIAYNMDLLQSYGGITSEEMYKIVLDGEWTLDKMIEICSSIYEDVNGNGKDRGDIYGYGCDVSNRTMPWVTSFGEKFFTLNEERTGVEITLGTEKIYSALERLCNFQHNSLGAYTYYGTYDYYTENEIDGKEWGMEDFTNGTLTMLPTTFNACFDNFTDLSFTYGMLPFPKYDTAQEKYLTVPEYDFSVYGVPTTLPFEDYDMVGIIMEALNAESWKTVSPAYYDEALKGRYSADPTTAEVVDLIMNGRVFEWGYQIAQFLVVKVPYLFCYQLRDNNLDLASTLAKGWDDINERVETVLSFYED